MICPGGGFHALSINSEGIDVAKWLAARGVAAFVLKYRLVKTGDNAPADFDAAMQTPGGFETATRGVIPLRRRRWTKRRRVRPRTIEYVTSESDADYRTVFDTKVSFVNDEPAAFYGPPTPGAGTDFERAALPDADLRSGLLGKPTARARRAREGNPRPRCVACLCGERIRAESTPAPPANVVPVRPEPDPNARRRCATGSRSTAPSRCVQARHGLMDPDRPSPSRTSTPSAPIARPTMQPRA